MLVAERHSSRSRQTKGAPLMTSSKTNEALARVRAESGERLSVSASSVETTNQHVEASRKALDRSMETLSTKFNDPAF
jgi:phage shock protein A